MKNKKLIVTLITIFFASYFLINPKLIADEELEKKNLRENYNLARDLYEQKKYIQSIEVLENILEEPRIIFKVQLYHWERNKIELFSLFNLAAAYIKLIQDDKQVANKLQNFNKAIAIYRKILTIYPRKVPKEYQKVIKETKNNLIIAKNKLQEYHLELKKEKDQKNQQKNIADLIKEIKEDEKKILNKIELLKAAPDTFATQQKRDDLFKQQKENHQKFQILQQKITPN